MAEAPEYGTGTRQRQPTEKGLDFRKHQLADKRKRIWNSVDRQVTELMNHLKVSTGLDITSLEDEQKQVNKLLEEYDNINASYRMLLTEKEVQDDDAECQIKDEFITNYKSELYGFFSTHKPKDSCARSVTSRSSKRSSASDSKMLQLAKLAALESAKKFAEEEAQLERYKFECEQKTKELQMQKELCAARAELAVIEQFDVETEQPLTASVVEMSQPTPALWSSDGPQLPTTSAVWFSQLQPPASSSGFPQPSSLPATSAVGFNQLHPPSCSAGGPHPQLVTSVVEANQQLPPSWSSGYRQPPPATTGIGTNQPSPPLWLPGRPQQTLPLFVSEQQLQTNTSQNEHETVPVVESFTEALKRSQLPKIELAVFAGDPIDFQQWLVSFERIIEDATSDPARRLHYLMQYTTGSAKVLVSGHVLNQTEDGYRSAKAELVKEFGNPYALARAYLKQIEEWKVIAVNDTLSLQSFSAFLKKCRGSMSTLRHLQQLNTDLYLQKIVSKLSLPLQINWRKVVDQLEQSNKDINFSELVDFVERQTRIAKHPVFSACALQEAEGKQRASVRPNPQTRPKQSMVFATNATQYCQSDSAVNSAPRQSAAGRNTRAVRACPKCTQLHDLDDCESYMILSVEDRRKFLMANHLCFGCYGHTSRSHDVRSCRRRRKCRICSRLHPTGLHGFRSAQQSQQQSTAAAQSDETQLKAVQSCAATGTDGDAIAMNVVMVHLSMQNNPTVPPLTVYAALDTMSTACFMSRDVWLQLGCPGEPTEITIKTVTSESKQDTRVVTGLSVSSVLSSKPIDLPKVYVQDALPVNVDEIPSHSTLKKYSYLRHLVAEIPERDEKIPVGLILGVNCPKALEPMQVIPSKENGPFAVKTSLGWCISGPLNEDVYFGCVSCNRIHATEQRIGIQDTGIKDMMLSMYEADFSEASCIVEPSVCVSLQDGKAVSQEDHKFLKLMEEKAELVDGHYQLPLPFRQSDPVMPNNRHQAVARAEGLRRRFAYDAKFRRDYTNFMSDIISKGYARKAPAKDADRQSSERLWYIPHHGVYHPQKPNKIRVVFDCSCQYLGKSLNKSLMQGPDLTNSLVGVLIRFRKEPVAVMADIEAMFYQVRVPDSQCSFLRFVWWPDGNVDSDLEDYQMTVHLFGAVSSPSCASYALKRTAYDNEVDFGRPAAETLRKNFYVDDMLKSVADSATAVNLISAVQQMCAKGGFRLTKFVSNSHTVLEALPVSDRVKNVVNVDLSQSVMPVERALGVHWCVENDSLGFRIILKDKPCTRRGILSTISSVYDPLGLAAPFLLNGKKLLQQLCMNHIDWDEEIEGSERAEWEHWKNYLPSLEQIQVPRSFIPENFGQQVEVQVHHFSDASLHGYGQCSYLRLVNSAGQIHCSFLIGKSRVPPLKQVTVPRLELTAAVVSARVSHMMQRELEYPQVKNMFWTDSKAVLGYISNDARRFHTFVANRVQLIRNLSSVHQWRYIESEANPADDASRGLDCRDITNTHRWFTGPEFLWKPEEQWITTNTATVQSDEYDVSSDPEVKKNVTVCAVQLDSNDITNRLLSYHSSWYKLRTSVAWILIVFKQLQHRVKGTEQRDMTKKLTVDELHKAEVAIFKHIQKEAYPEEVATLKAQKVVKKASSLFRLSPVLSEDELLCIEGRLRHSSFEQQSKQPIILPKNHHVTSLIIEHFHQQSGHVGKEFVLSLIREKYWIVSARQIIRQVLKRCVTCRKHFSRPAGQKMADLPFQRVTPDLPPFTFVGLDFFGPFFVKIGRSQAKRYGCIFTCMTTRAVHIEVAHSLEADSFINALHRFISRRGQPRELRSDNGTNFVGGDRELREAVQAWNRSKPQEFMRQNEIQWKFNPPAASHMGGIWERQIRTIRKLLSVLVNEQLLTEEALQTFLCIVENIINNRPLTAISDDPSDLEPLTPNHLLQLRRGPSLPPGEFIKQDLYCRRRWRQVQYLADVFWSRWIKEYLPTLQLRSKWSQSCNNLKVNDVVLIVDDSLPRNCWMLGRIVKTLPGSDGLVRCAEIRTKNGVFTRPIHKLCIIESSIDD